MGKAIKIITRREMVKNASLLGLLGAVSPLTAFTKNSSAIKSGMIEIENSKPGTLKWQLQYTRFDDPITLVSNPLIRNVRSSIIEGFVSKASVLPGEDINFMVSTNPSASFYIDIYRMGY